MTDTCNRWLIIELADQAFGMGIEHVQELIDLSSHEIHRMPRQAPHMAGVIRVRDSIIPLLDVRGVLGMPSMDQETQDVLAMLGQRREDHIRWIEELEASVIESRPFRLATDPHACAFGKWYDRLMGDRRRVDRFVNGNLTLLSVLENFDHIHQRIHSIAGRVTALVEQSQVSEARKIIAATREAELKTMIDLFDRTCELVSTLRRGYVVAVRLDGEIVGLSVDRVLQVTRIDAEQRKPIAVPGTSQIVDSVAQLGDGKLIQLLDVDQLGLQHATAC